MKTFIRLLAFTLVVVAALSGTAFGQPVISSPTADVKLSPEEGTEVSCTVVAQAATAGNTLTYRWYSTINGRYLQMNSTGATLVFSAITLADTGYYHCMVRETASNGATWTATSRNFYLTVKNTEVAPILISEMGKEAVLKANTSGSPTSYQWQKSATANGEFVSIIAEGANSATLMIPITREVHKGYYRCVVTGGTVTSLEYSFKDVSWLKDAVLVQEVNGWGGYYYHPRWLEFGHLYFVFGYWVWHENTRSWIFAIGPSPEDGIFIWTSQGGWMWTSKSTYPWIYCWDSSRGGSGWMYFLETTTFEGKTWLWVYYAGRDWQLIPSL